MEKTIIEKATDTMRVIAGEMIANANSGHSGIALGAAPLLYAAYSAMKTDPAAGQWFNRDRFVMSAGHGSALLYTTLHFFGYPITAADLKTFRTLGSHLAGHPELNEKLGIDCTTGPLGQGVAMAVGIALAEKKLAETYNRPGHDIINHRTFCVCGDGCLQEGVSYEACNLAGLWGLAKLILLYDANDITLDGTRAAADGEDVAARFAAMRWRVLVVTDANNAENVSRAITEAMTSNDAPTIIICKTKIGLGSKYEGSHKAHGAVFTREELCEIRKNFGLNPKFFSVAPDVKQHFAALAKNNKDRAKQWQKNFATTYKKAYPREHAALSQFVHCDAAIPTNNELEIHIPTMNDLWFKQKMMSDKNTMSYNKNFTPSEGYNPNDGTIDFPKEKWQTWHETWIGAKDKFYAYLVRKSDKKWIGDIAYHFADKDMPIIHIVIDNEFRGLGYAKEGLAILCENAKKNGIKKIYNDIPHDRVSAIKVHKSIGFREVPNGGQYCFLVLELDKCDGPTLRDMGFAMLNHIALRNPRIAGGSADVSSTTKAFVSRETRAAAEAHFGFALPTYDPIAFGVREFAMAAITNGLALHGFQPYCSTFLAFSDYAKPAIRLSALMNLPVTYIFSHDGLGNAQDGPTHQANEHIAALRLIPNLTTYRPADAQEVTATYERVFSEQTPAAIILSRGGTKPFARNEVLVAPDKVPTGETPVPLAGIRVNIRGSNVGSVHKNPAAILLASGTEVALCTEAQTLLASQGVDVNVISVPCLELFDTPIPDKIPVIAVEMGAAMPWWREAQHVISFSKFGYSAPHEVVAKKLGFTPENIVAVVHDITWK